MKLLLVTNKVKTYALGFKNTLEPLLKLGHEVIWAADFSEFNGDKGKIPCELRQLSLNSNPFKLCNFQSYKKLCKIIESEKVDAIQCSTPIGGLLGRISGKKMNIYPVIYAAHGLLYFKGAPLINRTIYKWEEQFLSRYTDVFITINDEDFEASKKLKLRRDGKYFMVHGAGVEVEKEIKVDRTKKRAQLGIDADVFMIVSGGFLNQNKNNIAIIEALEYLKDKNVLYVACGDGEKLERLQSRAKELGVEDKVIFPGFRTDFAEVLASADAFVMPSFREGVPRALLEAMDLGIPCIGSRTRGIRELIGENNEGGYLCNPYEPKEFADAIRRLVDHPEYIAQMAKRNREEVKKYSKDVVKSELYNIYRQVLK